MLLTLQGPTRGRVLKRRPGNEPSYLCEICGIPTLVNLAAWVRKPRCCDLEMKRPTASNTCNMQKANLGRNGGCWWSCKWENTRSEPRVSSSKARSARPQTKTHLMFFFAFSFTSKPWGFPKPFCWFLPLILRVRWRAASSLRRLDQRKCTTCYV